MCTVGVGCEYTNNTDPCDDGLYCNGSDTCSGGTCTHSGDPCTPPDVCDEGTDTCGAPELNAIILDHTIPEELYPGEPRLISITVRNTGTVDWTGNLYAIGTKNDPPELWSSTLNFRLGSTETVPANGGEKEFTFIITAPVTEDSYECNWQMVNIGPENLYFGEQVTQTVNVSDSAPPELWGDMVENTIPSDMHPDETRSTTITFQNTGTITWDENNMRLYAPTSTWGSSRIYTLGAGETVAQGESKVFTVILTAPATEGSYDCEWTMQGVWNIDGVNQFKPFGEYVSIPVNVDSAITPFLSAKVESHTIPSQMTASEVVSVNVTYENTGSGTWDGSDPLWVRLRTQNSPTGLWGTYNVNLDGSDYIEPGQTKTFTFNITAPVTDGPYNCRWQLQKQWPGSTSLFGELLDVPIGVGITIENCTDGIDNDGDTFIDCADSDCAGVTCDDGLSCTVSDVCSGGTCVGTTNDSLCDDANVCTDDSCDPATGCVNTNNSAPCDDGDACTTADTCAAGACVGGAPPDCDDANVCTDDSCDPATGCVNTNNRHPAMTATPVPRQIPVQAVPA